MAIEIKRKKEDRGQNWVIAQFFLFVLYPFLTTHSNFKWGPGMNAWGYLMMGWGLMLLGGGFVALAKKHGWRNLTPFPRPRPGLPLVTDGAYAYVRHPIYLGILLAAGGWAFAYDQYLQSALTVVLVFFLLGKIKREEAMLEKAFPDYPAYAAKVKKLIPGIY